MNLLDYIIPQGLANLGKKPASVAETPVIDTTKLGPKQIYLTWEATGRPMHRFGNPKTLKTFAIIGVVIALFFVILQEYFLILVIVSLIFVSQVLSKTPPETAKFELSSYGLIADERLYYWQELRRFFFYEQDGFSGVAVDLVSGIPSRLFLSIHEADREKIKTIMSEHVQFLEAAPQTSLDRTYKSITEKVSI